ncbi:hypothetical protein M0R45_006006 [Rubus argutus]|uniref:Uncharacterized protein n=1 Tax=Rubus argutus TaxID=59490 RepID=A0AAW1YP75_RUBAR
MSTQIVAHILVKALMAMFSPEFCLRLFLIPERVVLFSASSSLVFIVVGVLMFRKKLLDLQEHRAPRQTWNNANCRVVF